VLFYVLPRFLLKLIYDSQKRKLVESIEVVEGSITAQAPTELADYLASMQSKTFTKLSAIEMDDLRIPGMKCVSL